MITIVTCVWRSADRDYCARHAEVLGAMLARHVTQPYRYVVIADEDVGGFTGAVEVLRTPPAMAALAQLRTPERAGFPSSYRRLWLFSDEARQLGDRILLTDVDVVVTGDWSPLWRRDEDFVGWRPGQRWGNTERRVAGGLWLLRTGTRTQVYERFRGEASTREARAAGYRGSDQAWISHMLAGDAAVWPADAGIYSIRDMTRGPRPRPRPGDRRARTQRPPADARMVQFNGHGKPWHQRTIEQHPWVQRYWQ